MPRRTLALFALVLLATLALGGCGGNNGPTLSDPKEISTKAVEALQKAKSVHVQATVDGTLKSTILGGTQAGDITLAGTTLSGDVDFTNKKIHLTAGVPAMLGLTADVIVIGPDTYTKISLSGPKYAKSATGASTPADPATAIVQVKAFLDRPEIGPTKKDDASCGSKSCYVVTFDLTAAELKTLVPDTDLGDATITVSMQVEKDTLHPASLNVTAKGSTVGDLTLKVRLTNWDKAVTIAAPPADQVQ